MPIFKHTIKFVLQQTAEPNKLTSLRCFVRFNNARSVFASGEYIEPRYWNEKTQAPRKSASFTDGPSIEKRLNTLRASINLAFESLTTKYNNYPSPEELKNLILLVVKNGGILPGAKKAHVITDLLEYFNVFIEDTRSGKRVKPNGGKYAIGTLKGYNSAKGVLTRFLKFKGKTNLLFEEIDLDFYNDLKDYCYKIENQSDNYFGATIKVLKTCMDEAAEAGHHSNLKHKGKRFVKVQTEVENVYLNISQLEAFASLDLSKDSRLERVRDLFLVGCWTGLRFSDFTAIKSKNIQDGFIEIKTQKTGETLAIPVHDTVKAIMSKYKGKTANSLPPSISNVKLNEYIKEVAELAGNEYPQTGLKEPVTLQKARAGHGLAVTQPMYTLITTHTARRAFASNMFRMGVPSIVIMAITGHRTEKAFLKYIKVTPKEKAEIMREIWNRQTMKAV